jgi:hypothetical protein
MDKIEVSTCKGCIGCGCDECQGTGTRVFKNGIEVLVDEKD